MIAPQKVTDSRIRPFTFVSVESPSHPAFLLLLCQGLTSPLEELVNPDSKVHAINLVDGRLAIAFNDHPRPFVERRSNGEWIATRERTRLMIATSSDDGRTWQRVLRIDRGGGQRGDDFVREQVGEAKGKAGVGVGDPMRLRVLDEGSPLSTQHHYPYLLDLGPSADVGCRVIVAYTKSMLNIVSQETQGHEIWVACVDLRSVQ